MEEQNVGESETPEPVESAGCAGPVIGILGSIRCIATMLVCGDMMANKPQPNAIEGNFLPPGSLALGHSLFVFAAGMAGMITGFTLSVTGLVLSLIGLSKPNRENAYLGIICSLAGPAAFAIYVAMML